MNYLEKASKYKYTPGSKNYFYLSRSKIDLFMDCPRCFYLDRRLCISRPPGFPFTLNSAVDQLLKKEFDIHRKKQSPHPLMIKNNVNAIPLLHEKMDYWRDALRGGIRYLDSKTNFLITGGIDDIWIDDKGQFVIVDYKATSKNSQVNLDANWQISYKRQMEVYQWLFRKNNFPVSNTGYFVYCNADASRDKFDNTLNFDISIIPYIGNTEWIEKTLPIIKEVLENDNIPKANPDCDYCAYHKALLSVEKSTRNKSLKPEKAELNLLFK